MFLIRVAFLHLNSERASGGLSFSVTAVRSSVLIFRPGKLNLLKCIVYIQLNTQAGLCISQLHPYIEGQSSLLKQLYHNCGSGMHKQSFRRLERKLQETVAKLQKLFIYSRKSTYIQIRPSASLKEAFHYFKKSYLLCE